MSADHAEDASAVQGAGPHHDGEGAGPHSDADEAEERRAKCHRLPFELGEAIASAHPADDLCVGDHIECRYSDGCLYPATIACRLGDGCYGIEWKDAEKPIPWGLGDCLTFGPLSGK